MEIKYTVSSIDVKSQAFSIRLLSLALSTMVGEKCSKIKAVTFQFSILNNFIHGKSTDRCLALSFAEKN